MVFPSLQKTKNKKTKEKNYNEYVNQGNPMSKLEKDNVG